MKKCNHPGCGRETPRLALGYCHMHYQRYKKGLNMDAPPRGTVQKCSIENCNKEYYGSTYCAMHYQRFRRNGTVELMPRIINRTIRTCIHNDCERVSRMRSGYCDAHHRRFNKGSDMDAPIRTHKSERPCLTESCNRTTKGGGLDYCSAHYQRFIKNKDMDQPIRVHDIHELQSFSGAHLRIRNLWGSASKYPCANNCGSHADEWAYDGTDPTQQYGYNQGSYQFYSRYPEFYMPLCKSCHNHRDRGGAAKELKQYRTIRHEFNLTPNEIYAACKRAAKVNQLRIAEESADPF